MKKLSATFVLILTVVSTSGCLQAQATGVGEDSFAERAASELNRYATACRAARFAMRAQAAWLEVVGAYDPDNEEARLGLKHKRVGASWAPPGELSVQKDRGTAKDLRKLDQLWSRVARSLSAGHRRLAASCDKAGNAERGRHHRFRVLRFVPTDKRITASLDLRALGGVFGTAGDLEIMRRSIMIERVLVDLKTRRFQVVDVPVDERSVVIDRGAVKYIGVRSQNFTFWGTVSRSMLVDLAVTAERALAFSRAIFAGSSGFFATEHVVRNRAFFASKDEYSQVVVANPGGKSREYLKFAATQTGSCGLRHGSERLRASIDGGMGWNRDLVVSGVVQGFSSVLTNGLQEGMGHAASGLVLGESLTGAIDMLRERTSTGARTRTHYSMETWRGLALATAWQHSGTPVATLPLIKTSRFRLQDRVKSWAFVDYLLRRDPGMIRLLDQTAKNGAKSPDAVIEKFDAVSDGSSLLELEADYRSYWTEKSWLRDAVGLALRSREAKSSRLWFDAVSDQRVAAQRGPVGWWPSYPEVAKEVTTAIRTMAKLEAADLDLAMPALWTRSKKPATAIEGWLSMPGYRDLLLHPHLSGLSFVRSAGVTVLIPGVLAEDLDLIGHYPQAGNAGVPSACKLAHLGAEMATFLAGMGVKGESVGYPISLHLYRDSELGDSEVTCQVTGPDGEIEGFVHAAQDEGDPRASALGLFVFYPLSPLPAGQEIHVEWDLPIDEGEVSPFSFTTR